MSDKNETKNFLGVSRNGSLGLAIGLYVFFTVVTGSGTFSKALAMIVLFVFGSPFVYSHISSRATSVWWEKILLTTILISIGAIGVEVIF